MVGEGRIERPLATYKDAVHTAYTTRPRVRLAGIEPTSPAWQADVLPLDERRKFGASGGGYTLNHLLTRQV